MLTPGAESAESANESGPAAQGRSGGGSGADRPVLWLCRHGETEWSRSGQHTSRTDLQLTDAGRRQAVAAGGVLRSVGFDLVLTSPLRRARETAGLAGFGDAAVEADAVEWAYGEYEGMTTAEIREHDPGWTIWAGQVPGGETPGEVAARADRVIDRVRSSGVGKVLLVSHGHFLRVLAARWLGLGPEWGERFILDTGTVCELGWAREAAAVAQWNHRVPA